MPGSLENSTGSRRQREDMSGGHKILARGFRIHHKTDRISAVERGNAGRDSHRSIDALGKRRMIVVGGGRTRDVQFLCAFFGDRSANQAAGVFRHEINNFRGYFFRRADQIAFIFPVFIIGHDDEPAVSDILQNGFHTVEFKIHILSLLAEFKICRGGGKKE